jgi:hypothetical protein
MALTCLEDSISWAGKMEGFASFLREDLEVQERVNIKKRRERRKKMDFLEIIPPPKFFKKKPRQKGTQYLLGSFIRS